MSIIRPLTRPITRPLNRGIVGGIASLTPLQRILALSPSLLVWPAEAEMTVATNGTGAAPGVGDPVGRIEDLSGNGNNLIAGTWATPADSSRALLTAGGALNFDGVDDYMSLLNAISITTNMTVVRAFKRSAAGIQTLGLGNSGSTAPNDGWWFTDNVSYQGLGASQSSVQAANTSTGAFVYSAIRSGASEFGRRNGTQIGSRTAGTTLATFTQFGLVSTNRFNNGEISFLAVFPTELTGADLALVEQIAASTNGATLS